MEPPTSRLPDATTLHETMIAFKKTLQVSEKQSREIKKETCKLYNSPQWFSAQKNRITASTFGMVLSRKSTTPPDNLVLHIIQRKSFSTPATKNGLENEKSAIKAYISHQQCNGHPDIVVSESGFNINPSYYFLGATPDGAVYDPVTPEEPYGFLEVKCPYSCRNITPAEPCDKSNFFCTLNQSTGELQLKEKHHYYSQVQGQLGIGERRWCDFVVSTQKGISIQRIQFNSDFWNLMLPKLCSFYDNCVLPELVSPVHFLGLPMRNLSDQ